VKVIKGSERKELLLNLGVLSRPRKAQGGADSRESRDKKRRFDRGMQIVVSILMCVYMSVPGFYIALQCVLTPHST